MTTQQSYPEHNDVDTSVVAESHAPETPTDAPAATATASAGEETPEQPAPANVQRAEEQTPPTLSEPEAQEVATPSPEQAGHNHAAAHTDGTNEGEVKEFTAYIEEFQQTEARFSRALQEAEAREAQEETTAAATSPSIAPTSSVEEVFVPEFTVAWEAPDIAATPTFERTEETKETTLTTEPATAVEAETSETKETTTPSDTPEATTPPARPVSPLLRPATRIRMPRHSARHREEARAAVTEAAPQAEAPATQPVQNEATTVETPAQTTESTQEVEQPRPARRYRFDNRSKTAPATTSASTPTPTTPTTADTTLTNGHTGNGQNQSVQPVEREAQQPTKPVQQTQPVEQTVKPNVSEPDAGEHEIIQAQPTAEPERRRKHGQERQRGKEQQAAPQQPQAQSPATTVAEIAATLNAQQVIPVVAEPVAEQKENIDPEDLPPLEYADLQKANTRRRRRRHTNGASVAALTGNAFPAAPDSPTTTPTAPTTPAVPSRPIATQPAAQARPVVAPSTSLPQRPVATPPSVVTTNSAPYSITSGFTVSQMNQGSDMTGPFMGPEPSPARGTLAAQNVRSIRTDAQRTPAYPVRSTEATSASVNQLANIVAQAIQTQTDRMVAELRRANQAPTNISVSMPPFPSNERVGVFVDVANLLYSARTLRMAVDFGKLLDFLRGNRRLIRAQAYCPTSPQPGDEQMFLQAVKGLGYRITTKNYKTFSSGAKKADLDLDLCMDVVRLVDGRAVDCIVLVSGDSDFMPMLDYCSDHGVRVEVAAFDEAMSATLRQSCDLFINLSMLEEIRA